MGRLRTLIWLYLGLLIFEGALRKWILPSLDTPLLIIRDPLVMWIYFQAYQYRLSFNNAFFMPNIVLAILTALFATLFGMANIFVTIYGLRTNYLQIPLIFLMPQILNRKDVINMGRFILYSAIPISILVLLQFKAPIDSLLNKGAMATHYGTVRPSGPFSFISGLVAYFALTSAFVFYAFLQLKVYKIWLTVSVTFAVLLASACSGSRSCLISISIVGMVAVLYVLMRGKGIGGMIVALLSMAVVLPLLSQISIFQEGSQQLTQRFQDVADSNGEDAGGSVKRFANTMLIPLVSMGEAPLFGNGLGIGTNAAAGMLRGERVFLGPEDEWGRLFFECGPILGLCLCIFRMALTFVVVRQAYRAFIHDNPLPLLIFGACGLFILNGQWGVPTILGFAIFGAGLILAACVEPDEDEGEMEDEETSDHDSFEDENDHPLHVADATD